MPSAPPHVSQNGWEDNQGYIPPAPEKQQSFDGWDDDFDDDNDDDDRSSNSTTGQPQYQQVSNGLISDEPRHEKTCFCYMRTAKAQISLRIRAPDQRLCCSLPG